MPKVVYLGPPGTFTEKAARERFPNCDLKDLLHIGQVIDSVENEIADYGVVPSENYYEGAVRDTLVSLLRQNKTRIIGETFSSIVHCLGAISKSADLKFILSKDQAIYQCSDYLSRYYPNSELVYTESTAFAAKKIDKERLINSGAIASKGSILEAGLEVIAEDLCPNNKTRFMIFGREDTEPSGDDKTLIVIRPRIDEPGVLYSCLGVFADRKINLEYLQSRPNSNGGYLFYMELVGHHKDELVSESLRKLRFVLDSSGKDPSVVKVLGSYRNSHWKS